MQGRQNLGSRAREMNTLGVGGEGSRTGEKEVELQCSRNKSLI